MVTLLKSIFTFLNVVIMWKEVYSNTDVCETNECLKSANMILKNMDTNMSPCHDFYAYACGNFAEHYPIPSTHDVITQENDRITEIKHEFIEFLQRNEDNDNEIIHKIRDAFHACLDEEKIEKLGDMAIPMNLAAVDLPIKPPFNTDVKQSFNLAQILAKLNRHVGSFFLFDVSVNMDRNERETNRFTIGNTPTTTKSNRLSLYLDDFNPVAFEKEFSLVKEQLPTQVLKELLKEYMTIIVHYMYELTFSPFSKATPKIISKRIDDVIDFILQIEETKKLEPKGRVAKQNKKIYSTLPEIQKITDEILKDSEIQFNWFDFVESLYDGIEQNIKESFKNGEIIMVMDIDQLKEVFKILSKVQKKVLFSTLWWLAAHSAAFGSTKTIRDKRKEYVKKITETEISERKFICANFGRQAFPFFVAYQLTKIKNSFELRNKAIKMTENIIESFTHGIENSEWLDEVTKMAALSKLSYLGYIVSFPDWTADQRSLAILYGNIPVQRNSFFFTYMQTDKMKFERNLKFIHKKNEFNGVTPSMLADVNASYYPSYNGIEIPIGILDFPHFNLGLESLDYGGMGIIVGHELVHAFDNSGKDYDSWGILSNWWDDHISKEYENRQKCFVASYNKFYYDTVEMHVNGEMTLPENIADNGGFIQALNAYRKYVSINGEEPLLKGLETFSHEQLFTLAFANVWCENAKPQFTKFLIENDEHAPNASRVNGVAKNSADFAKIWGCSEKTKLNKEPKCKLW